MLLKNDHICQRKNVSFFKTMLLAYKSLIVMAKLHELLYLSQLAYSRDLASNHYFLFPKIEKMTPGKNGFLSNAEVIAETN